MDLSVDTVAKVEAGIRQYFADPNDTNRRVVYRTLSTDNIHILTSVVVVPLIEDLMCDLIKGKTQVEIYSHICTFRSLAYGMLGNDQYALILTNIVDRCELKDYFYIFYRRTPVLELLINKFVLHAWINDIGARTGEYGKWY